MRYKYCYVFYSNYVILYLVKVVLLSLLLFVKKDPYIVFIVLMESQFLFTI